MLVKELIQLLNKCDPEAIIEMRIHGHRYDSSYHEFSHGEMWIGVMVKKVVLTQGFYKNEDLKRVE